MTYDDLDYIDIGYCARCGADMTSEPPAATWCGDCNTKSGGSAPAETTTED